MPLIELQSLEHMTTDGQRSPLITRADNAHGLRARYQREKSPRHLVTPWRSTCSCLLWNKHRTIALWASTGCRGTWWETSTVAAWTSPMFSSVKPWSTVHRSGLASRCSSLRALGPGKQTTLAPARPIWRSRAWIPATGWCRCPDGGKFLQQDHDGYLDMWSGVWLRTWRAAVPRIGLNISVKRIRRRGLPADDRCCREVRQGAHRPPTVSGKLGTRRA